VRSRHRTVASGNNNLQNAATLFPSRNPLRTSPTKCAAVTSVVWSLLPASSTSPIANAFNAKTHLLKRHVLIMSPDTSSVSPTTSLRRNHPRRSRSSSAPQNYHLNAYPQRPGRPRIPALHGWRFPPRFTENDILSLINVINDKLLLIWSNNPNPFFDPATSGRRHSGRHPTGGACRKARFRVRRHRRLPSLACPSPRQHP